MRVCALILLAMCAPLLAANTRIQLERPEPREFVMDRAGLLSAQQITRIAQIADRLLTETATPIIVVTIQSMADHGGQGMRIEQFATRLFNQWEIGHATLHGQSWNSGMLLVVSVRDRQARIELGAGWGRSYDAQARQIMDTLIIPEFKSGDFGKGIVQGVDGMSHMARGLEVPRPPIPPQVYLVGALFFGLMIFTGVSLYRRGSSGWAWMFWAAVFTVVGMMLVHSMTRSRGGGGFSGGSFGGGFSGGGGASGRW
jgi:uncharacterized protein